MSDKLEMPIEQFAEAVAKENARLNNRIEKLEAVTTDDAKWLATYHKWCEMNGCAPSSSDLISARKALEGKDDMSVYKEGYRAVEEAMGHPSPEFWVERKYD